MHSANHVTYLIYTKLVNPPKCLIFSLAKYKIKMGNGTDEGDGRQEAGVDTLFHTGKPRAKFCDALSHRRPRVYPPFSLESFVTTYAR